MVYGKKRFSFDGLMTRNSYAHTVAGAVKTVIEGEGYRVKCDVVQMSDSDLTELQFQLHKDEDDYVQRAKITLLRSVASGGIRVHEVEGFPDEIRSLILNVPGVAPQGKDAPRAQVHPQDNPLAKGFGGGVGAGRAAEAVPAKAVNAAHAVAAVAVSIIDIATVRQELATRERRRYIGASGIGETCQAYHALSLRGFESDLPEPKLLRIFRDGHRIEARVIEDLAAAGHTVMATDPATGEQWEYTSHGGHHVCHLDGFITLAGTAEEMTLEIKSMNKAMFAKFKTKGVRVSHPEYYDQCIDQLGLVRDSIDEVKRCFFVAYYKDNSEYHAEIIEFDPEHYDTLLSTRVSPALKGESERESAYPAAYKCTQCFKRTACWKPESVTQQECWHCAYAYPDNFGGKHWSCTKAGDAKGVCEDFTPFKVTPHGR